MGSLKPCIIQIYVIYSLYIQFSLDYPPPLGLVKMLADSEDDR